MNVNIIMLLSRKKCQTLQTRKEMNYLGYNNVNIIDHHKICVDTYLKIRKGVSTLTKQLDYTSAFYNYFTNLFCLVITNKRLPMVLHKT